MHLRALTRAGLGLVILGCLALPSAPAQAKGADLSPVLEADALVRPQGGEDFTSTKGGNAVVPGSAVRAPSTHAVTLKVSEGVSLRLAPDTAVTVRPMATLPAEHPGASPIHAFQLLLVSGELDVEVREPKDAREGASPLGVLMMLPNGRSLGVWRGTANVAIRNDKIAIALYQGMAIAGSASKWKALTSGTSVLLAPNGEAIARPMPGTPEWADTSTPAPFVAVRGDEPGVVGAAWQPTRAAATYRIETWSDPEMVGPETIKETGYSQITTDPLPPGSYLVRVRAVSADGIVGQPSTPKALRVVRITVPPLAETAPDGAIILPGNAPITIGDPTGLEVAATAELDKSAGLRWSPAPSQLTVGSANRREFHVRDTVSHVETRLLLVRRDLRAHVVMSPKPARWPDQPIDIVVKVDDESGYLDPSTEPIKVDVRVDLDKVDLAWKNDHGTWTARLPPRTSAAGPWVVRVDVQDRAGVPIGASLLDVDGPGSPKGSYRADR